MHINIIRRKEDSQSVARLRKNLKLKKTQRKILLFIFIGIVLFFYSGDGINFSNFSGYAMCAMLFWGAAAILYLENFYPSFFTNARDAIDDYKQNENLNTRIEINDDSLIYELSNIYIKMDWDHFRRFKIYKEYIILLRSDNLDTGNIIKISELTSNQFNEFCVFLKARMKEIK